MSSGGGQVTQDNHFVPCVYLRQFTSSAEQVFTYRTLVSHSHIPPWEEKPLKSVAYHTHLYTRTTADGESDEIEEWFSREFESPAKEPLRKATSDAQLTPEDWRHLVRFLAAQDVRTPARFIDNLERWNAQVPQLLDSTLKGAVRELESAKETGKPIPYRKAVNSEYLPLRITPEVVPGQKLGRLMAEIVVGRQFWLFSMRHTLTKTAEILHEHQWTILSPPENVNWFTSDNPVVRLNYHRPGEYDFKGGWGNHGGEILFPIGPRHLMYTQIGRPIPRRGTVVAPAMTAEIRKLIAENAHRSIFSAGPEHNIEVLRPRVVDSEIGHLASSRPPPLLLDDE